MIDVYINGVITERLNLSGAPIQNYNNVNISQDGGFKGNISDLIYYNKAIDIFKINQIVGAGPNLKPASLASTDSTILLPNYKFLSGSWYSNKM
jgi:hypothetical protein